MKARRVVGERLQDLKVVRGGRLVICSWPCEFLEVRYAREIAEDASGSFRTRVSAIKHRLDPVVSA